MPFLLLLWATLFSISVGPILAYYAYMRVSSSRPWNLNLDKNYVPKVSFLIPTYNEKGLIGLKLRNLVKIDYPQDLIQHIIVDSASTDGTSEEVQSFIKNHPEVNIRLLEEKIRKGKSVALNNALKYALGEIVVVSDADCFLPPDILKQTLPYLADASVGAVCGREIILNRDQSWITKTENAYRDSASIIRVGESKLHSTIFFEGGFSAYKAQALHEFDVGGCDDSGTALSVTQNHFRTILVPETQFFTFFPHSWSGKTAIKIRRATQLLMIWKEVLSLLSNGKLLLPKQIALSEAFLYIVNPLFFIALILTTPFLFVAYPIMLISLLLLLIPKIRVIIVELIQSNLILCLALVAALLNRRYILWDKVEESRSNLDLAVLENFGLI